MIGIAFFADYQTRADNPFLQERDGQRLLIGRRLLLNVLLDDFNGRSAAG